MRERGEGWYSRHYLPHLDQPGLIQAITFRLADSLPQDVMHELDALRMRRAHATWRRTWDAQLDAGHGSCVLRDERAAALVQTALQHFDGERYRLFAWVVMPNHVHTLIEPLPEFTLSSILHSWKRHTAKEINRLLGREGPLWQREYFDRAIRDERHFDYTVAYIHHNPVKAGLVRVAHE